MAFCSNCGKEVDNNEVFCPECGEKMEGVPAENAYQPEAPASPVEKYKKFIILGVAAAVVIAIVAMIVSLFGGGAKGAVNKMLKGMKNADAKKIVSVMPDEFVDYVVKMQYDGDKKEYIADLQEELDDMDKKELKKISWKIKDVEKLDKDEVEQMSAMNAMMGIKKDCKAAQNIEVELKGPDGETETITLTAVKIGSKWFIHPLSLASLGM